MAPPLITMYIVQVNAATGTWEEYKKGKGSNSKLLTMLREKHGQK